MGVVGRGLRLRRAHPRGPLRHLPGAALWPLRERCFLSSASSLSFRTAPRSSLRVSAGPSSFVGASASRVDTRLRHSPGRRLFVATLFIVRRAFAVVVVVAAACARSYTPDDPAGSELPDRDGDDAGAEASLDATHD